MKRWVITLTTMMSLVAVLMFLTQILVVVYKLINHPSNMSLEKIYCLRGDFSRWVVMLPLDVQI